MSADELDELIARAESRLSFSRIGLSVWRETDRDLTVIADLIAGMRRLRAWKQLHSADVLSIRAEQAEVEEQRDDALAEVKRLTPRVIETVGELDALPVGSVVLDVYAASCTKVTPERLYGWVRATWAHRDRRHFHRPYLPVTVLYLPEGSE